MADDVLSQSEIDKLLAAFSTGEANVDEMQAEEDKKKIKTYDFKRPDKFSKDQIRTLNMLHDNFARLFNTYLSTYLRALVNVEVASVEQLTYQEFVQSIANPSVIAILALEPLKGNIIMEFDTRVCFAIIDRVFGGQGNDTVKSRVLTEIEEAVIRRIYDRAMSHLQEAWSNVVRFTPKIEAMESNPQFAQIVPPNDMVVIITLQITIGSVEGLMNICIPYLVLEPIMSKLTTTFWVAAAANKEDNPETEAILRNRLTKAIVPVIVQMGTFEITLHEFLTLSYGDVLQMDTKVNDELKCFIGNIHKFYCRPGTSGKKKAVQITRVISEGDEDSND